MDNIKLTFEDEALDFIVEKSIEFKLGARGLRSILEGIMTDAMFELPSKATAKSLRVTLPFVKDKFQYTSIAQLKVA